MTEKRKNELPPQFARARRRNAEPVKQEEPVGKPKNSKKSSSVFSSIKKTFHFSNTKKKAQKKLKKPTPKKKESAPKKSKAKKKGVIATKAEKETVKPKKAAPKKKRTQKATVKTPKASKKTKQPTVEFAQMDVHMEEELKEHMEAIEKKHTKKADRPRAHLTAEFVPHMVQGGEEVKPLKAAKKTSWWPFGKKAKKAEVAEAPEDETETVVESAPKRRGAIAALTKRMETEETEEGEDAAEQEVEIAQSEKELKKKRKQDVKELRKKAKELKKTMKEESEESEEVEEQEKQKRIELDQRIAEKEEKKKEREAQIEEQERQQAQANKDLDAMALGLMQKKKKHMGLTGILKSINNLGMGKYRAQFVQNLAMMLNAGLPLVDALKTLQTEMRSRAMRKVIGRIAELVDSGHPLWRAMEEQYMFSPYEVALIRVGEEAGNLARNAQYLAEQQEKDHALKQKVKMAMIYPSIVMVLLFVVIMGLGLFVLPNLVQVLYSLNADLPVTTRGVIFITEMFSTYGTQAVPALLGGMVVLFLLAKYTPFRIVSQWFVFRIPGIGRLAREATIARFGVILGGLLEAGVPLVESLQSLEDVTHIVSYKRMYRKMAERVALGDSFAICFKDIRGSKKLIPASMQQLIVTGERSGTLSETFLKVASIYEKKAEETAEKLPTILEPMLLLLIGGLVGTIAFAIITPIYSVVGNVGR